MRSNIITLTRVNSGIITLTRVNSGIITLTRVNSVWVMFLGLLMACSTTAHADRGPNLGGSPAFTKIHQGDQGDAFVGVWVDTPKGRVFSRVRPPMAVSLVVDTSGSMSGEKIAHARQAAVSVLQNMREGDIISVFGFANHVRQIAAPTTVTNRTRSELVARMYALEAGGSTNMYDALNVAVNQMVDVAASHAVRRVIILSDGQANVGPSDPHSLGNIAARGTEYGAQVTAIGIGLDYDESTLGALAVRSAGRLYHLEHPHQMASILEEELQMLATTVGTGAYIEIVPAPGVVIIDTVGMGAQRHGGSIRVPLGNLYAGQQRDVLFRAKLPARTTGKHAIGTAQLVYEDAKGKKRVVKKQPLHYAVTTNAKEASRSQNGRVAAMTYAQEASQAQLAAAARLNSGDAAGGAKLLEQAEQKLDDAYRAAPAASKARFKSEYKKVKARKNKASSAKTRSETRGAALEATDGAYEIQGY